MPETLDSPRTRPNAAEADTVAVGRPLVDRLRVDPLNTAITVAVDLLAAAVALIGALLWHSGSLTDTGWLPWLFLPLLIGILAGKSMYRRSLRRNFLDEIGPAETAVAFASLALLVLMFLADTDYRPSEVVLRLWLLSAFTIAVARLIRVVVQRTLRIKFGSAAPTIVLGNDPIAHQLVSRTRQFPEYGLEPIGYVGEAPVADIPSSNEVPHLPHLGLPRNFETVARGTGAEELIVAFAPTEDRELIAAIRTAHRLGMRVWVVPRLYDAVGVNTRVEHIGGLPLMVLPHVNPKGWQFALKGLLDRVLTAFGLLLLSPVFLTLMLLVRLSSPGPIFFKQERIGRDGLPFDCLKFRSMRPPRASDAEFERKAGDAPGGVEGVDRRTRIGKIMRQTSMDELPQLLNVLRGDMSLVGPRPERPEYVDLFEMQIRRYGERHRVKAGVTGWAQVHGLRGQTSIADRAEWDNYYIENWSVWLDVKILFLTVLAVLKRAED
ncbi:MULTISPECIES: sugar transferase [unclassified Rhodococcus (in: high G+C Gram-positive bacteria)]|uniref:sugar transferase n=1 Tax=unclassified Rhodococcus (in: high G+C Gram-positive bacteria) TaxID=192944 RepID=UPI000AF4DB86|nr:MULTISPECIES: sugar transferase [unclassified Rhodococcus (in: high G+C Gram-positive bacteria)]